MDIIWNPQAIEAQGIARPALIIATPEGFVGAAESKAFLVKQNILPYMKIGGTSDGNQIAVAMVNALLYSEGDA